MFMPMTSHQNKVFKVSLLENYVTSTCRSVTTKYYREHNTHRAPSPELNLQCCENYSRRKGLVAAHTRPVMPSRVSTITTS
ncbi:hypothetical protein E2C01_032835 [Portunus trituberculatus]|uniref:Uncharacterized protein n=1 Tax=Portunus trituberculatus TaxID=210409 RepID=A0A5B7F3Z1_PORTR|nr:hypothetical protein [Portunus trituberculatus]